VKFSVKQHIEPGENILTQSVLYCLVPLFPPCFHCTDSHEPLLIDLCVGRINPGTSGETLTTQCSGVSEALMTLSGPISDSSSASQFSPLLFGLSLSPFQLSQFLVSEMLLGPISSSRLAGWRLIGLIQWTFNTCFRSPGRSHPDQAGGKVDLSDNSNGAALPC